MAGHFGQNSLCGQGVGNSILMWPKHLVALVCLALPYTDHTRR